MKKSHTSNSQNNTFKSCKYKWYLRYIAKYYPKTFKKSLVYGKAFHLGGEYLYKTGDLDTAIGTVYEHLHNLKIENLPEGKDAEDERNWMLMVSQAHLRGYYNKFYLSDLEVGYNIVESEKKYQMPIINPKSRRKSRNLEYQFIADMVLEKDGEIIPVEFKTASKIDDAYKNKLKIDTQATGNMYYLSEIYGVKIRKYLYRVMKKPAIRLKKTETKDEYLQRLMDTMDDTYYEEIEVTRTDEDIEEFKKELWVIQKDITESVKINIFPKNTNACSLYGECEYMPICAKLEGWEKCYG